MYNQYCHYGFMRPYRKEYDEIEPLVGEIIIECHNNRCSEFYCKYYTFTGGQIPDTECPFFMRNMRGTYNGKI